ncbi:MAG: efflux RND transporter periplasmic adaptor subunit [Planctomycetota bacterium]|jgi:multidrug efflux pump subunit AcrA (membrane-fusion protein)
MSTNVLPKKQISRARSNSKKSAGARWWKPGLLIIATIAVVTIAVTFIPGVMSSRESGPRLTHTITRGDLLVTVTEQGTLESSSNLEIRCKVEGWSTVNFIVENGTIVKPGDELVRLDSSAKEETISQRKIDYQRALAGLAGAEAEVERARISIPEYEEGRYVSQLESLKKDEAIAKSNLTTSQNMLAHTEMMFKRGYVSELEVEGNRFTVTRAQLELAVTQTAIDVLNRFTKEKELETLNGTLKAAEANLGAQKAQVELQKQRLDHAIEQFEHCVIVAEQGGMVIHPSAAKWKDAPEVEEGANVHTNQVLLMVPDLSKMQVKLGIHESIIDRIKPGLPAKVILQDSTIMGEVSSVAEVTRPAGWWTGNVVKFDTIVALDSETELKPGMSAEVEVTLAWYEDVLTIPVAAVVEIEQEYFCWVMTTDGPQQRTLQLGDTNDQFILVEAGLKERDEVVLNPLAFIEQAQTDALKPLNEAKPREPDLIESSSESKTPEPSATKPSIDSKKQEFKPQVAKPKQANSKPTTK